MKTEDKKVRFKTVLETAISSPTPDNIFRFGYTMHRVLLQGSGLVWSEIDELFKEVTGVNLTDKNFPQI